MKLVIEIPDEDYKWVCDHVNMGYDLYKMIANGTSLTESDDCVSRQVVINTIMPYCSDDDGSTENLDDLRNVLDDIESLSSVQPKRDKGEWTYKHRIHNEVKQYTGIDEMGETHTISVTERYECDEPYCSKCGKLAGDTSQNFCSNCGADMR